MLLLKQGLVLAALLVALPSSSNAQSFEKQFRLCVPVSRPQECKNLDRAGSGVKCVPVEDSTDCTLKLQNRTADFGLFKPEEALIASHFLQGVTVIGDVRHEDRPEKPFSFIAVAMARRKNIPGNDLSQAKNLSLCHPGMGTVHTGWSDQVLKEMDMAILDKTGNLECQDWKSALQNEYFAISRQWGSSCRPGKWSLDEKNDYELKSQYPNLCSKCPDVAKCAYNSDSDLQEEALKCFEKDGDVVYLSLEAAESFMKRTPNFGQEYAFVCRNLTLSPTPHECHFAKQPWSAIVTVKEITAELASKLNDWLRPLGPRLGVEEVPERATDGWQRALIDLLLEDYHVYNPLRLQSDLNAFVSRGRTRKGVANETCDRKVRWCLKNVSEKPKCGWMATAAWYAGIKPNIECVVGDGEKDCVHKVSKGEAEVVVTDIDLAHYARGTQKLRATRFVETSNDLLSSVVAVLNVGSEITSLRGLKSKKACFPSYEGIGYGTFLRDAFNQSFIEKDHCPYYAAVADYFGDSCIPGAHEFAENKPSVCALCKQAGHTDQCSASTTNSFYGEIGALKCLKENGGDVAFIRLQKILEAFQKNLIDRMYPSDFKVICKQPGQNDTLVELGPRALKCSLATVPSYAVVSRDYDEVTTNRDVNNVLSSLDKLFGLDETSQQPHQNFYLFHPFGNNPSVIFPDGASSLMKPDKRVASVQDYQKLISAVPIPCGRGSAFATSPGRLMTLAVTLFAFILTR